MPAEEHQAFPLLTQRIESLEQKIALTRIMASGAKPDKKIQYFAKLAELQYRHGILVSKRDSLDREAPGPLQAIHLLGVLSVDYLYSVIERFDAWIDDRASSPSQF